MMSPYLLFLVLAFGLGTAQRTSNKHSNSATTQRCQAWDPTTVNATEIEGDWYVLEQWSPHLADSYRCVHERLNLLGTHTIQSNWTGVVIDNDTLCENRQSHIFMCDIPTPTNVVVLLRNCEYKVTGLETDYNTYLAANLCQEYASGETQQVSFIWSRRDCLPDKLIEKLRNKINGWGGDASKHFRIDQYECPDYCRAPNRRPHCF